jgi:hypothetical protein
VLSSPQPCFLSSATVVAGGRNPRCHFPDYFSSFCLGKLGTVCTGTVYALGSEDDGMCTVREAIVLACAFGSGD